MSKEIVAPAPVSILLGIDGSGKEVRKELTFKDFLGDMMDGYGGTKTPRQMRDVFKLLDVIEGSNGKIELEAKQYELLKAACEWPREAGLSVRFAKQCRKFYEALEAAGIGSDEKD